MHPHHCRHGIRAAYFGSTWDISLSSSHSPARHSHGRSHIAPNHNCKLHGHHTPADGACHATKSPGLIPMMGSASCHSLCRRKANCRHMCRCYHQPGLSYGRSPGCYRFVHSPGGSLCTDKTHRNRGCGMCSDQCVRYRFHDHRIRSPRLKQRLC